MTVFALLIPTMREPRRNETNQELVGVRAVDEEPVNAGEARTAEQDQFETTAQVSLLTL